jgi:proprotein convertase subtilisin/kexin type 5
MQSVNAALFLVISATHLTVAVELLSSSEALGTNISSCPANMVFRQTGDIETCVCDAGFTGAECDPCVPGTFKSIASSSLPCSSCPQYSTSLPGSTDLSDCLCLAGYTPGDGCEPCQEGTYKVLVANIECSVCPDDTHSKLNSSSISDCLCVAGYESSDIGCVPCAAGSSSSGYGDTCISCGSKFYQPLQGQAECLNCPEFMVNIGNAIECHCEAGYYLDGGICSACASATFKALPGNESCAACDATSYAAPGSQFCHPCPPNTTARFPASSVEDCECNPGFESNENSTCIECSIGKYWNDSSNTCEKCPANTYQDERVQVDCKPCTTNSISEEGSDAATDCFCEPGFRHSGLQCLACSDGYISESYGSSICEVCPQDHYWLNTTSCHPCPDFSSTYDTHVKLDAAACLCVAGYEKTSLVCVPCETNYTCPGQGVKELCFPNSTSEAGSTDQTQCTCLPGFWLSSPSVCDICPENNYCLENSIIPCEHDSSSPEYSFSEEQCICNAGYMLLT